MSNPSDALHVVVPAAGAGKRMGAAIPKQYLKIQDKTLLQHTLQRLMAFDVVQSIVLPVSEDDQLFSSLFFEGSVPVHACLGGEERSDSVLNGLRFLRESGVADDAWVMVHDAARPCVQVRDLQALFDARNAQGALLALEVRDTMKRTDRDGNIVDTVDREHLWHAQTPQMAQLGVLIEALEYCLEKQLVITDEASALEHIGLKPKVVAAHPMNIKVTRPEDLQLVECFLDAQSR